MNVKNEISLNWDEAPDTITPEIYAKIRGRSVQWARDRFNENNFPRIDGKILLAEKSAVMLHDMGINIKNNAKQGIEILILMELQKLNKKEGETNEKENGYKVCNA